MDAGCCFTGMRAAGDSWREVDRRLRSVAAERAAIAEEELRIVRRALDLARGTFLVSPSNAKLVETTLQMLGFTKSEAGQAVMAARERVADVDVEALLQAALRECPSPIR